VLGCVPTLVNLCASSDTIYLVLEEVRHKNGTNIFVKNIC